MAASSNNVVPTSMSIHGLGTSTTNNFDVTMTSRNLSFSVHTTPGNQTAQPVRFEITHGSEYVDIQPRSMASGGTATISLNNVALNQTIPAFLNYTPITITVFAGTLAPRTINVSLAIPQETITRTVTLQRSVNLGPWQNVTTQNISVSSPARYRVVFGMSVYGVPLTQGSGFDQFTVSAIQDITWQPSNLEFAPGTNIIYIPQFIEHVSTARFQTIFTHQGNTWLEQFNINLLP